MQIDPSVLNTLQPEQHERFVWNAKEIVIESFFLIGVRDSLRARLDFFQKQSHLFLWATAQALKKCFKANMLLGCGVVKRSHEHTELAKTLKATHSELLEIDTTTQSGWEEQGLVFWPDVVLCFGVRR